MLMQLLHLPIMLLLIGYYALRGVVESLRGRKTLRAEASVLVRAPREDVWRLSTAEHAVFDGPPRLEIVREPLEGSPGIFVNRILLYGKELACAVARETEIDEANGTASTQVLQHELSSPPSLSKDYLADIRVGEAPRGTLLTVTYTVSPTTFHDWIQFPIAARQSAARFKQQCEKAAGTQSALTRLADNGLLLAVLAMASFVYLFGWQDALLVAAVIALHEAGHAAAMRIVGMEVQGIYLIPFFGGAAVPKTAYRTQGHLGFVALMGPGFSLIPALGLVAVYLAIGEARLLHAAAMFGIINAINLLPIYPLDGGLILNSLLGSLSRRVAVVTAWVGVLTGLGIAIYLESFLLGIPFLIFALLRYLSGGDQGAERDPLSVAGGGALVLAFLATFALHAGTFVFAVNAANSEETGAIPLAERIELPMQCDLPPTSAEMLERYLAARSGANPIAVIRTLATADRAGQQDIVSRALTSNRQLAKEPRLAEWLRLAKSGTLAEIEASLAAFPAPWLKAHPRSLLIAALMVYGRTDAVIALFPRNAPLPDQWAWINHAPLAAINAERLSVALSLLEGIRPHTEPAQFALYVNQLVLGLGESARFAPPELRQALIDLLVALAKADRSAWPKTDDLREFDARVRLAQVLASLGQGDLDPPAELAGRAPSYSVPLGVIAGNWADRGETSKIEDLRARVARIFAAKGDSAELDPVIWEEGDVDEAFWEAEFEFVAAATRIGLSLARNDVAAAEQRVKDIGSRPSFWQPHVDMLIDYHLEAGAWSRADAWHQGKLAEIAAMPEYEGKSPQDPRLWIERGYHLKRAAAAALRGAMAIANASLERAGMAACLVARAQTNQRASWFEFLQKAYAIKAAAEGRLSGEALAASLDRSGLY